SSLQGVFVEEPARVRGQRQPDIRRQHRAPLVSRRSHTCDREVVAVQNDVLADDLSAASKSRLPQGVTENDPAIGNADAHLAGVKELAGRRAQAEHVKVVRADQLTVDPLCAALGSKAQWLWLHPDGKNA